MLRYSTIFCCLISINLYSAKLFYPELHNMPVLVDGKKIPGVMPVLGNYLYMAKTEVSNRQYREFLSWLQKNEPSKYKENFPDTTVWKREGFSSQTTSYFGYQQYQDYPVLGISQVQAQNFCKWLHHQLQEYFKFEKIPVLEFRVRLPDEEEWMHAARGGLHDDSPYPWDYNGGIRYAGSENKHKGKAMMNCRMGIVSYTHAEPNYSVYSTRVDAYWPNGYGLYNMCGNAAEWLEASGLYKGGSWSMPPYNCRIDFNAVQSKANYTSSDVGFRYVIEIQKISDTKPIEAFEFSKKCFNSNFLYIPREEGQKNYRFMSNEVSNEWYKQFLLENTEAQNTIQKGIWKEHFRYEYFEQYGWHSAFNQHAVVGVSYESAIAFCKWLEKKYHENENRPYKKIEFRLPTEHEWEFAAMGGSKANYPWGGQYIRNSKGCYLANFSPLSEEYLYQDSNKFVSWLNTEGKVYNRTADGALIAHHTKAYFPNNYGLFNFSGNVAEMVAERGLSKGGSWLTDQYGIMIISKGKYDKPNAELGFRVLAEVIEK